MAWYERLIEALPDAPVVRPPDTMWKFYLHFVKPVKWLVLAVLVLSLCGSLIEMGMYVFLGWLVDWVTQTPASEFFAAHGWQLAGHGGGRSGAAGRRSPSCRAPSTIWRWCRGCRPASAGGTTAM